MLLNNLNTTANIILNECHWIFLVSVSKCIYNECGSKHSKLFVIKCSRWMAGWHSIFALKINQPTCKLLYIVNQKCWPYQLPGLCIRLNHHLNGINITRYKWRYYMRIAFKWVIASVKISPTWKNVPGNFSNQHHSTVWISWRFPLLEIFYKHLW